LFDEIGLTLGADFLGNLFVANASAFLNADAADGAADDPIRAFWAADEGEWHGVRAS
jgi:hypothetical protein